MSEGDSAKKLKEKEEEMRRLQKEREAEDKKMRDRQKQIEDELNAMKNENQKLQVVQKLHEFY